MATEYSRGQLEYTNQEILGTYDERLHAEVKSARSSFDALKNTINGWGKSAEKFYSTGLVNQSRILTDLAILNGSITGVTTSLNQGFARVAEPINKLSTSVSTIAGYLPQMSTALVASSSSLNTLVDVSRTNTALIETLGRTIDSTRPVVVETPHVDSTADYSDVLGGISDIVGSIRDSISGFDGRIDSSRIYPGLHSDLDALSDIISDIASESSTEDGFDVDSFTANVKDVVNEFSTNLVDSLVNTVVPGIINEAEDFVSSFTEEIVGEISSRGASIVDALATIPTTTFPSEGLSIDAAALNPIVSWMDSTNDELVQFREETNTNLLSIDSTLSRRLSNLTTTVRRSGESVSGRSNFGDVIDSFDDDSESIGSSISTGNDILSGLWGAFKDYAGDVLAFFSWKHIQEHMDQLHADATDIIRNTGVSRKESLALRSAVMQNAIGAFGISTKSDEREQALSDAIRAGMVSQQHLEQATEVSLAYNKLLGTTIDFSQGWAKTLMVTKTNADDYLESVALSIDDFSNKFFVSADKLQSAAEKYTASALIFTTSYKEFSKALNQAIQMQAAQEAANIQSMDPAEFLQRIAWSDMSSLSETDIARLSSQFGVGPGQLMQFKEDLRNPLTMKETMAKAYGNMQKNLEDDLARIQSGGSSAEATISQLTQVHGYDSTQIQQLMAEISQGSWGKLAEYAAGDYSNIPESEAQTQAELKGRMKNAANLRDIDYLKRGLEVLEDQNGIISNIYNLLSGMGISGALVGTVGAFGVSSIFKALTGGKGILGSLFGGGAAGGVAGGAGGLLGKLFGGIGGGGTAAGGAGGFLSKIFGGIGGGGATAGAGTGGLGGLGAKFASSKLGSLLMSPASGDIAEYLAGAGGKGLGGKAVGALGSKAAVGGSIAGMVIDAADAASNSQEWLGSDSYESKWASSLGGAIGGTSGGLGGAAMGALKWGAIGTMIAPGIGTAIGAGIGAVAGGIGGENIAKGFDKAFSWLGDVNDSMDLAVDKLGVLGHAFVAAKDTLIDIPKNVFGGFFTGLGDVAGGIKDGFGQFLQGDILGGFKSIGSGFVDGVGSIGKGFSNAVTDVIDDWTMSAEDRIKKRKGEINGLKNDLNDQSKDLSSLSEEEVKALNKNSGVVHTGKSIFGPIEGRKGYSGNLARQNSFAFTDYGAKAIVANNKPIDHSIPAESLKQEKTYKFMEDDLAKELPTYGAMLDETNLTELHQAYRTGTASDIAMSLSGSRVETPGTETLSTPIVDALSTNIAPLTSLVEQILNAMTAKKQVDSRDLNSIAKRGSDRYTNANNTNSTVIDNYQGF